MINIDLYDEIFDYLSAYIKKDDTYNCIITKQSLQESNKFPLIVFTENQNSLYRADTTFRETLSSVYYEVNIYTKDKSVGGKKKYAMEIAKELSQQVDYVLGNKYKLSRTYCSPTPNIDNTIYRITMRYEGIIIDGRSRTMFE